LSNADKRAVGFIPAQELATLIHLFSSTLAHAFGLMIFLQFLGPKLS